MRLIAVLLSVYLLSIASVGSVLVIKNYWVTSCESDCCSKKCEIPSGCKNDKCMRYVSFSIPSFIVGEISEIGSYCPEYHENINPKYYIENYIFQHSLSVFHPPEGLIEPLYYT